MSPIKLNYMTTLPQLVYIVNELRKAQVNAQRLNDNPSKLRKIKIEMLTDQVIKDALTTLSNANISMPVGDVLNIQIKP